VSGPERSPAAQWCSGCATYERLLDGRLGHFLRPDDRIWLIEYVDAMATAPPSGVPAEGIRMN
jgi:hypothetical protein